MSEYTADILPDAQFLTVNGIAIATRFQPAPARASPAQSGPAQSGPARSSLPQSSGPMIVWLGGFNSNMRGIKAERLAALAQAHDLAFLRFDYSGHGESSGKFTDGTISSWLADSEAAISHYAGDKRLILIGSSMGAWIALRLVQNIIAQNAQHLLAGLLLLAPAPDFTSDLIEPGLTAEQQQRLIDDGYFAVPSDYSSEPTIYTRALLEDGRSNRVLTGIMDTHCPVTILQGMADPDVPYGHALKLMAHLPKDNVTLTLIKDGDHRLSREQDLILLEKSLIDLVAQNLASKV